MCRNATYEKLLQIHQTPKWPGRYTRHVQFQDGTAEVTARIRYVDGSDIYRETVTEFLRQIVPAPFPEKSTEQANQDKLAAILIEKASSLEDKFSETDIVYPMIKVNGQWKVTALDEENGKDHVR